MEWLNIAITGLGPIRDLKLLEEVDYVTAEMKNYIEPLIQAELTPIMITGQPRHIIIDDLPDIK